MGMRHGSKKSGDMERLEEEDDEEDDELDDRI